MGLQQSWRRDLCIRNTLLLFCLLVCLMSICNVPMATCNPPTSHITVIGGIRHRAMAGRASGAELGRSEGRCVSMGHEADEGRLLHFPKAREANTEETNCTSRSQRSGRLRAFERFTGRQNERKHGQDLRQITLFDQEPAHFVL